MLSEISWSTYLTAMAAATASYYIIVGLVYYRKEITGFLNRKTGNTYGTAADGNGKTEGEKAKDDLEELEEVVASLRSILDKAGQQAGKEGLISLMNQRLANYGGLRRPAFRNVIRNFIIDWAKTKCGINFSEEELETAWEDLAERDGDI